MFEDKDIRSTPAQIFGTMLAEDLCYEIIMSWRRRYFDDMWSEEDFMETAREEARRFAKEFAEKMGYDYEE